MKNYVIRRYVGPVELCNDINDLEKMWSSLSLLWKTQPWDEDDYATPEDYEEKQQALYIISDRIEQLKNE